MSQEIMHSVEPQGPDLRKILSGLIDRHGPKWLGYIRGMLGNQADAEDVLQEAVRRVLARNRTLSSEDQVRMYLSRVIGNTAIDMYNARKRERMNQIPLQESTYFVPACLNPQRFMEEKENSAQHDRLILLIREGLARLPVKQYEALRLTVLEPGGASIRDAGAVHGIPYSTLRHRTIQGLKRLRKYIHRTMRSAQQKIVLA